MPESWRFRVMMLASLGAFLGVLVAVLGRRNQRPPAAALATVAAVVVLGGMAFAKFGATAGWPAWLYYGMPAGLTWFLPPLAFRMRGREVATYLPLALVVAPVVHVAFSLLLGWKEYMPFLPVPSLAELFDAAR